MPCGCGKRIDRNAANASLPQHKSGPAPSAEGFSASAAQRYMVVPRQTSTSGTRFSTLTAAQDYARRTGGIIRQL